MIGLAIWLHWGQKSFHMKLELLFLSTSVLASHLNIIETFQGATPQKILQMLNDINDLDLVARIFSCPSWEAALPSAAEYFIPFEHHQDAAKLSGRPDIFWAPEEESLSLVDVKKTLIPVMCLKATGPFGKFYAPAILAEYVIPSWRMRDQIVLGGSESRVVKLVSSCLVEKLKDYFTSLAWALKLGPSKSMRQVHGFLKSSFQIDLQPILADINLDTPDKVCFRNVLKVAQHWNLELPPILERILELVHDESYAVELSYILQKSEESDDGSDHEDDIESEEDEDFGGVWDAPEEVSVHDILDSMAQVKISFGSGNYVMSIMRATNFSTIARNADEPSEKF